MNRGAKAVESQGVIPRGSGRGVCWVHVRVQAELA